MPADCALLPLSQGALLVSRQWAIFCRVPAESLDAARGVIAGRLPIGALGRPLVEQLKRHGFFGLPRKARCAIPTIRFQITNGCNLACEYCCTGSGGARPDELTEAEWRDAVDEAVSCVDGPLRFALLGGEPLLAPFAAGLASYILSKDRPLVLYTNGSLLAIPGIAREVAGLIHAGAEVRVSLAGPSRETCDRLSGNKRFDAAIRGIGGLADSGARVHVDLMLFPETVDDTIRHLPAFREMLPESTPLTFGIAFCGGRELGQHMFPSRTHLEAALDRISLEAGQAIPCCLPSPVSHRREACRCAFGHDMHVRSDGLLFNCFKMEEPLGSIREEPLGVVWRRAQTDCRPATRLPACSGCALATLCGGGCRSENILYTGKADQPLCGPWRVRILSELLADDRVSALEWPTMYLINEARARGLEAPSCALPAFPSRNNGTTKG
ncbi:MAG: radical SAM protein [Deltaproteobacteria bacterium]|nr:radical SAM protein [Deltaproteobacteria bacterium]